MGTNGSFWDVVEGRSRPSTAAELLGWKLRSIDPALGAIEVEFELDSRFTNPVGHIQGGFVTAMLDDTMGPALVSTLEPDESAPTISLTVQFLAPARVGRFVAHARVVQRGRSVAFMSGELLDQEGQLLASASANAAIRRMSNESADRAPAQGVHDA